MTVESSAALRPSSNSGRLGHGPKSRSRLEVTVTAERNQAGGDECGIVDRRGVANLEVARQPTCRDSRVPARFTLGDQDREFEQSGECRSAELAQSCLSNRKVPAFDRSVEDRPRVPLRGDR